MAKTSTSPEETTTKKAAVKTVKTVKKVMTPVEKTVKKVAAPAEKPVKKTASPVEKVTEKITETTAKTVKAVAPAATKMVKITQVKSAIGYSKVHKATIRALGIHRMHETVEQADTPALRGMLRRVSNLVVVEE